MSKVVEDLLNKVAGKVFDTDEPTERIKHAIDKKEQEMRGIRHG